MFPCSFDEANVVLSPPDGMTEDEIGSLRVYSGKDIDGNPVVISCYKMTSAELAEITRTGRVWLTVLGNTMPPVSVQSDPWVG